MKQKSFAVLILAAAAFARADISTYSEFTSGSVIPLGSSSTYVASTGTGNLKINNYSIDSTYKGATLKIGLNNSEQGDYLLTFFGTGDSYAVTNEVTVTGVTDNTYSRKMAYIQRDTGSNLADSETQTVAYQTTYMMLDALPAGNFTIELKLVKRVADDNSNWCGNYGCFKLTKDAALKVAGCSGNVISAISNQTNPNYPAYIALSGDVKAEKDYPGFGSTKNGATVEFTIYCDKATKYFFQYEAGTKNSGTSIEWTLARHGESLSGFTDSIPKTSDWFTDDRPIFDHNLGTLDAGVYTLVAKVVRNDNSWAGNFANFVFTKINETLSAAETKESGTLSSDSGVYAIDLNGNNLTIKSGVTLPDKVVIRNTSDTQATFTAHGANLNKYYVKDNVRLVALGTTGNFRKDTEWDFRSLNSHTGGTVFQNQPANTRIQIYNAYTNLSSGAIVFNGDGHLEQASKDVFGNYTTLDNDIEVNGTGNIFNIGPNTTGTYSLNGDFSGPGSLYIYQGFNPPIAFKGLDNDEFTGTLYLAYTRNKDYGYYISGDSVGFKKGTVCLTNRLDNNEIKCTSIRFDQTADTVYFGHLVTDDETPEAHSNTWMIAKTATTLRVGAKNLDGHFAGAFKEDGGTFKLYKEGTGTWELCSTNSSTLTSGIEVAGGTLVANSIFTGGAVQVDSGAALAGTGTVASVTFSSGAILSTTNLTVTGWSYFQSYGDVTSAAPKVYLDPDVLKAGKTYTILKSNGMPGSALLHEDLTNQIAGVYLTQANNTLTLTVPEKVVAPRGTAVTVSASSKEDALAAVAIRLTDDDIDAGRKTSYYKKVATSSSDGWSVAVELADEVEVEIGADTTPSVTASTVTFSTPKNLKQGLYYGVASGTSVGSLACTQNERYDGDGTTPPTLSADMPDSGVMYYSIEVSDTAKSSN